MWPLSIPAMLRRLIFFENGGIVTSEENPTWMRCQDTVQTEVLSLQKASDRKKNSMQTINVMNWLFTREQSR